MSESQRHIRCIFFMSVFMSRLHGEAGNRPLEPDHLVFPDRNGQMYYEYIMSGQEGTNPYNIETMHAEACNQKSSSSLYESDSHTFVKNATLPARFYA